MKRFFVLILIIALVFSLVSCSAKKENALNPVQKTDAPSAVSEAPTVAPETKPKTEEPTVRAIVFDSMIDDPISAKLRGGNNKVDAKSILRLKLYETSPGVYKGDGTLERAVSILIEGHKAVSDYIYRTGLIEARPDAAANMTMLIHCDYYDEIPIDLNEPVLGNFSYTKLFTTQESFEYTLKLEGENAQMLWKAFGTESVFFGKVMQLLAPEKTETKPDVMNGKCMYINSTYSAKGNGNNDEYRAMLTAKKDTGGGYTGELSLYGTGKAAAFTDGAMSFTLSPFDKEAYAAAGGQLSGTFDAYGVIHGLESDYFVLMDGDKPLLEPKNSGMAFYGRLLPEDQYGQSKQEAEETKRLMHTLYDAKSKEFDASDVMEKFKGKDMTDPKVQKEIQEYMLSVVTKAKPAWYPDWIMPKPVKLMGDGEWAEVASASALPYRTFNTQYVEDILLASKVYESYKKQLSGNEGFVTRATEFDPENHRGEAVIIFNIGAYKIFIDISQQILFTDVTIRII